MAVFALVVTLPLLILGLLMLGAGVKLGSRLLSLAGGLLVAAMFWLSAASFLHPGY